jgi:hypothetical protein
MKNTITETMSPRLTLDNLIDGIRLGNTQVVSLWIDQADESDWVALEEDHCGIVELALNSGAQDIAVWLLERGYEWNTSSDNGVTRELYDALDFLTAITAIYGIDFVDGEGFTALMRAASNNNSRVIRALLALGADPLPGRE